jgi:hypothetical protein
LNVRNEKGKIKKEEQRERKTRHKEEEMKKCMT